MQFHVRIYFLLIGFGLLIQSCATSNWTEDSLINAKSALKYEYSGGLTDPTSKQVFVDQKGRAIIKVSSHDNRIEAHRLEITKENKKFIWKTLDELSEEDFTRTYQIANDAEVNTFVFYESGVEIAKIRYSTLPPEALKTVTNRLNEIIQDL